MQAKLSQKFEITPGTLQLEFSLGDQTINFQAGQFFQLILPNPMYSDNRGNKRFFGFTNSPTQNTKITTATRIGPSAFKRSLLDMPLGSDVEIGALGGDLILPIDTTKPIVIITRGIGIVPHMSIFRFIAEKSLKYDISLFYPNDDTDPPVFLEEIKTIFAANQNLKFLSEMPILQNCNYYISGVPQFVTSAVKNFKDQGVDLSHIKFEIFTGY